MTKEARARRLLDTWYFWITVAFFAIGALTVWQYKLTADQARAQADRAAQARAAQAAQVSDCYASARTGPATTRILAAIDVVVSNSITTTRDALAAVPDGPLTPARKASLERLVPARRDLRVFAHELRARTPTPGDCADLAHRLDVPVPKEIP